MAGASSDCGAGIRPPSMTTSAGADAHGLVGFQAWRSRRRLIFVARSLVCEGFRFRSRARGRRILDVAIVARR
eukprot:15467249-Alexandrium_andersonii.AAC.1